MNKHSTVYLRVNELFGKGGDIMERGKQSQAIWISPTATQIVLSQVIEGIEAGRVDQEKDAGLRCNTCYLR